jgi:hypothetical protein
MSEEQDENTSSEPPRDEKGRFAPKNQSESIGRSQPSDSDYTKMNSYLAKQLGLTDKLADFQTQYQPNQLFKQLSFMADNASPQGAAKGQPNSRPPNQQVAPISPPQPKHELPGKQIHKPNLDREEFSVSFQVDPRELFRQKSDQK